MTETQWSGMAHWLVVMGTFVTACSAGGDGERADQPRATADASSGLSAGSGAGSSAPSAGAASAQAIPTKAPGAPLSIMVSGTEVPVAKIFATRLASSEGTQLRFVKDASATCEKKPGDESAIADLVVTRFFFPSSDPSKPAERAWAVSQLSVRTGPTSWRALGDQSMGRVAHVSTDKSGAVLAGELALDEDDNKIVFKGGFLAEACPPKAKGDVVENAQDGVTLTYEGIAMPIRGATIEKLFEDTDRIRLSTGPLSCNNEPYGDVEISARLDRKSGKVTLLSVDGLSTENSFQKMLAWKGRGDIERRAKDDKGTASEVAFDVDGTYGPNRILLKGVAKPRLCKW